MRSPQVTVRSSETGLTFTIARSLAERHDSLTIIDGAEPSTDQRGPSPRRNARREGTPSSADDKEN